MTSSPFAKGVVSGFVLSQEYDLLEPVDCAEVRAQNSPAKRLIDKKKKQRRASLSSPVCRCSSPGHSHHRILSPFGTPVKLQKESNILVGDSSTSTPTKYDEHGFELADQDEDEDPFGQKKPNEHGLEAELCVAWSEILAEHAVCGRMHAPERTLDCADHHVYTTPLKATRRHPLHTCNAPVPSKVGTDSLQADSEAIMSPEHPLSPFAATPRPSRKHARENSSIIQHSNSEKALLHAKLRALVVRGVPQQMRGQIWQFLGGTEQIKSRFGVGYYTTLVARGAAELKRIESAGPASSVAKDPLARTIIQIGLDLNRTFVHHVRFKQEGGQGQTQLRNVLSAYALHNEAVGYCQGMSFVAAVVLMHIQNEEDAFWVFTSMLSGMDRFVSEKDGRFPGPTEGSGGMLKDYYEPRMSGLLRDGKIMERLMKRLHPRLYAHLMSFGVEPLTFVTPWFMSLWTSLPCWNTVLRFWDMFFLEGQTAIFRMALALLNRCESQLLQRSGIEEVLPYLLNLPREMVDPSLVAEAAALSCSHGSHSKIDSIPSGRLPCQFCHGAGVCDLHDMIDQERMKQEQDGDLPRQMDTPRPTTRRSVRPTRANSGANQPSFLKRIIVATPGIMRARAAFDRPEGETNDKKSIPPSSVAPATPSRWSLFGRAADRSSVVTDLPQLSENMDNVANRSEGGRGLLDFVTKFQRDSLHEFSSPKPSRSTAMLSPDSVFGHSSLGQSQLAHLLGGATELDNMW